MKRFAILVITAGYEPAISKSDSGQIAISRYRCNLSGREQEARNAGDGVFMVSWARTAGDAHPQQISNQNVPH
jgi:hypothetical protein